eukprot:15465193-Alexandrium_andersonii.AAC.1
MKLPGCRPWHIQPGHRACNCRYQMCKKRSAITLETAAANSFLQSSARPLREGFRPPRLPEQAPLARAGGACRGRG